MIKDLAPWIAIGITLILSILVPLFTQIANNNFKLKLQKEQESQEKIKTKIRIYENFLISVSGCVCTENYNLIKEAGASIFNMYVCCPKEWQKDLFSLYNLIRLKQWDTTIPIFNRLSTKISDELNQIK